MSQRRELDSERQIKETEEQRKAREVRPILTFESLIANIVTSQALVAQKEAIKSEVNTTLKAFYCELCDKQYINVAQFDEHVRGYAHTHKLVCSLHHSSLCYLTKIGPKAIQGDDCESAPERC